MLPNTGNTEERVHALASAIICVYASTFYNKSKEYLRATNHMVEEERMAVIIQQIIGSGHGDYWYPNFAGVARSLNFYPVGDREGGGWGRHACFGFGRTVVDNGYGVPVLPDHRNGISKPRRNGIKLADRILRTRHDQAL